MQTTQTLSDFLLVRIAEDDAAANGVGVSMHLSGTVRAAEIGPAGQVQVVKWDRRRVLAECEAKRRILELHRETNSVDHHDSGLCASCGDQGCCGHDEPFPCQTLRVLALPYSAHAEYRPEWRPRTWDPDAGVWVYEESRH